MSDSFHIRSIHCENFMPYHNERIDFPNKDGVIIVSGMNGHGKTSLVSAIRFGLFGRVNSPTSDGLSIEEALFDAVNDEGKSKGKYSYKVTLDIDYLGEDYKIIRSYSPKPGVKIPKTPGDYELSRSVVKGDYVLNDTQQEKLLSKVMSENVSRFYLFDGELLDEYKKILFSKKHTSSNKMRDAIEDILGLPLLQNTRNHLSYILSEKESAFQKATKENENTNELGVALEDAKINLEQYSSDMKEAETNIQNCSDKIDDLRDALAENHESVLLIDKKKDKTAELQRAEQTLEKKNADYVSMISDAWSTLLSPMFSSKEEEFQAKYHSLNETKVRHDERKKQKAALTNALNAGYCNQCGQRLNASSIESITNQLNKLLSESDSEVDINEITSQIDSLQAKLSFVKRFTRDHDAHLGDRIKDKEADVFETETLVTDLKAEIAQLSRKLENTDVGSFKLEEIRDQLAKEEKKLAGYKIAYDKSEMKAKEEEERIKKITTKIASLQISSTSLKRAVVEKEKVSRLHDLFEASIEKYRQEKRQSVEKVTSELYCKLSSASWIGGLHITDDYGVEAYGKNGDRLPRPSSGYAHLAAFSLIGGLHRNVPVKGPLFLDTPSGRIDKSNTMNLIRVLPELSNQVILLTHDKEFNLSDLRSVLGSKIIAEYEIQQISQTRSVIKRLERGGF